MREKIKAIFKTVGIILILLFCLGILSNPNMIVMQVGPKELHETEQRIITHVDTKVDKSTEDIKQELDTIKWNSKLTLIIGTIITFVLFLVNLLDYRKLRNYEKKIYWVILLIGVFSFLFYLLILFSF